MQAFSATPILKRRVHRWSLWQFQDAVASFADETVVWDGGCARRIPPLYSRVRAAMSRRGSRAGTSVHQSRLPCGIDPLDWCRVVDAEIGRWSGGGTLSAHKDLAERSYGTDQAGVLVAQRDPAGVGRHRRPV